MPKTKLEVAIHKNQKVEGIPYKHFAGARFIKGKKYDKFLRFATNNYKKLIEKLEYCITVMLSARDPKDIKNLNKRLQEFEEE